MAAPEDRVQLLKNESAAGGGDPSDSEDGFPVQLDPTQDAPEVQGFFLQPPGGPQDEAVYSNRDGSGNMVFRDPNANAGLEVTLTDLLAATGVTPASHRALEQLVHEIAETSYFEVTRTAGKVTSVAYYTDVTKTQIIRETTITRTAGRVSEVKVEHYTGGAGPTETLTGTVSRTAGRVSSIDWVLS